MTFLRRGRLMAMSAEQLPTPAPTREQLAAPVATRQPWQTPTLEEVDYSATEALPNGPGTGDGAIYAS